MFFEYNSLISLFISAISTKGTLDFEVSIINDVYLLHIVQFENKK